MRKAISSIGCQILNLKINDTISMQIINCCRCISFPHTIFHFLSPIIYVCVCVFLSVCACVCARAGLFKNLHINKLYL